MTSAHSLSTSLRLNLAFQCNSFCISDEDSVGVVTYKELMKTYADKATYALQVIAENEGVWDIFITKYLEVFDTLLFIEIQQT